MLTSLNLTNVCIGLTIATICYFVVWPFFSPLRGLPGPFMSRFSRLWYLMEVARGDFHETNIKLHDIYGPVVRIAPNEYSISDPAALKSIYGHGTTFVKAPWYAASGNADPDIHDLFTDRNPKRHAENRKKVAALYSMTSLLQYEPCVEECTIKLMDIFESFTVSGQGVNMQEWLQYFAFDVIGRITLSKRFGFLDYGADLGGMIAAIHTYLVYCANVGVYAEWHPYLSKLLSLLPATGFNHLITFTQKQIDEHLIRTAGEKEESTNKQSDFITKLLQSHAEQPQKLSMQDVFLTCINNIGAGSDTTSISLTAILYHVIQNSGVLTKLRTEIDEQVGNGYLSTRVTFKEAQGMPYLQACIKEGLRMHPATGLPLARVVPKGGADLCGRLFPEGTVVGVNAWVMNYNKSIFGQDADVYRPERWLGDSKEVAAMERCFMTFGQGSRTCIGKNLSLMEISRVVPELVRRFDFHLVKPSEALQTTNVWFVKQRNFNVRISQRVKEG